MGMYDAKDEDPWYTKIPEDSAEKEAFAEAKRNRMAKKTDGSVRIIEDALRNNGIKLPVFNEWIQNTCIRDFKAPNLGLYVKVSENNVGSMTLSTPWPTRYMASMMFFYNQCEYRIPIDTIENFKLSNLQTKILQTAKAECDIDSGAFKKSPALIHYLKQGVFVCHFYGGKKGIQGSVQISSSGAEAIIAVDRKSKNQPKEGGVWVCQFSHAIENVIFVKALSKGKDNLLDTLSERGCATFIGKTALPTRGHALKFYLREVIGISCDDHKEVIGGENGESIYYLPWRETAEILSLTDSENQYRLLDYKQDVEGVYRIDPETLRINRVS